MTRKKIENEQVRKLQRTGEKGGSYIVTLPRDYIDQLGWQKKQKVLVTLVGDALVIQDWKK